MHNTLLSAPSVALIQRVVLANYTHVTKCQAWVQVALDVADRKGRPLKVRV